ELEAGAHIRIVAEANSLVPFESLEVIHNGAVISQAKTTTEKLARARCEFEIECESASTGWMAARCRGRTTAHSSPVYIEIGRSSMHIGPAASAKLLKTLELAKPWIEHEARFDNENERQRLEAIFASAKQVLLNKLNS